MGGLVAALILAAGLESCAPEPITAPSGGLPAGGLPAGNGGGIGGGSSSGGAAPALVGSWRTVILTRLSNDVLRTTTTWRFDAPDGCRRTIETFSLAEGVPRAAPRDCRWLIDVNDLVVTFAGDSASVRFRFSFQGFSPRTLVLDGFVFDRIG